MQALRLEKVKNTRQLLGLITRNADFQKGVRTSQEAGESFEHAISKGLDEVDKAKAAKKKAREAAAQLPDLSAATRALFDNPSSIWGKSLEDLKALLEPDGFTPGGYKGTSTAEKFVRQGPPYMEIRINFGGGQHYPDVRDTPWYYIVQKDGTHSRIIKESEIGSFQGGDIFNEKYVVYDGPSGAKLGGPKKDKK